MEIIKATFQHRNQIVELLQSNKLPTEDLPETLSDFFVAVEADNVVGAIGMERYGSYSLLRSMVVDVRYRNQHIAEALVQTLEQHAKATETTTIYLLTETADKYFIRKGYDIITRAEVPEQVMQSSEFSHVCPVSAIVMKKQLGGQSVLLKK